MTVNLKYGQYVFNNEFSVGFLGVMRVLHWGGAGDWGWLIKIMLCSNNSGG